MTVPVVRCKFIVSSKLEMPYSDQTQIGRELCWQVKMNAIWEGADSNGANIARENHIFSKATPSGELTMTISNPEAAAALKTGQCYYMDFTPAGLPAYAQPKN
jgi:hypothetical protein